MAMDFRSWIARQRAPVTLALAGSLIAVPLLRYVMKGGIPDLSVSPKTDPWTVLTYPWALDPLASPMSLVMLFLLVSWLVQFGTSVEREMSSRRFVWLWIVFTVIPGIIFFACNGTLAGPWVPATAIIVAWGARNIHSSVMLYGILPLSGLWLAVLASFGVVFGYGQANPAAGLLTIIPLGLAWCYARELFPFRFSAGLPSRGEKVTYVRGATNYKDDYFENVKQREMEREEQERLRKLFEGK
jgi:hypothetical protein